MEFIFTRIKNIIAKPQKEWFKIKEEAETGKILLFSFSVPLIVLISLGHFFGSMFFGESFVFAKAAILAIILFLDFFTASYLSPIIIHGLASSFDSKKDLNSCYKLVAYSSTPVFISYIIYGLFPSVSFVLLFSVYGIYLFWKGVEIILETKEESKFSFVTVSIVITLCIYYFTDVILSGIVASLY